jgi:hypothetical protein
LVRSISSLTRLASYSSLRTGFSWGHLPEWHPLGPLQQPWPRTPVLESFPIATVHDASLGLWEDPSS